MRNGNTAPFCLFQMSGPVLTVPMRNGNYLLQKERSSLQKVLTVPMRNGNQHQVWQAQTQFGCSYRTYEEWKQVFDMNEEDLNYSSYRTYEEWKPVFQRTSCTPNCVLTVPMRNGNFCRVQLKKLRNLFLPYL